MDQKKYYCVTTRRFTLRCDHEEWIKLTQDYYNKILLFYYQLYLSEEEKEPGSLTALSDQKVLRKLEILTVAGRDKKPVPYYFGDKEIIVLKIIDSGTGQMCNQLLFCAQVAASAYERKFQVKYYSFPLFSGIVYEDEHIESCLIKEKRKHRCHLLFNIFTKFIKCFGMNAFLDTTYYWYGWPYIDYSAVQKNAVILRNYFRFSNDLKEQTQNLLDRRKDEIICGFHMRRGDYKNWYDGKYFYDDSIYIRVAKEILINYSGRQVRFVLFSNEDINEAIWLDNELEIFTPKSDAITELCLMSICDLLVGPPSTFSAWASFVGDIKRFVIDDEEKIFDEKECYVSLIQTDGMGNRLEN